MQKPNEGENKIIFADHFEQVPAGNPEYSVGASPEKPLTVSEHANKGAGLVPKEGAKAGPCETQAHQAARGGLEETKNAMQELSLASKGRADD